MDNEALNEGARVAELLRGHVITQVVASGVRLGIFDYIGDGYLTEDQVSRKTGIGLTELRPLLSILTESTLLNRVAGSYCLTPASRNLLRDSGDLYGQALMSGAEYYEAFRELDFSLRSGKSGFERRHGRSLWNSFNEDSETVRSFMRTMRWNTEKAVDEIFALFKFPDSGVIADLGAGDGSLAGALLLRFPGIRAILVDLPGAIEISKRTLAGLGVEKRCEFTPGDFFIEAPRGANLYILKSVVHNWNNEDAIRILQNCRRVMRQGSRLLVIERVLSDCDPLGSAIRDLMMLVLFGSHDRTTEDYIALAGRAGFAVAAAKTGPSGILVMEAIPALGQDADHQ